ncbi:NAD(P)H-dependent flavin oxidoreductase [Chitinophaga vietnamensis]|uniref:NAD(P)H-dependent flavin oxidoreductase n=1 Tax=Chitinophaga vietnamensis TaxID=2593957 RepID=UPI001177F691|nr:nitronate monooxygenase [Chitinophaga vietnamensis]
MQWQNNLTRLLGITYPVIQAPMLGITTPAMVAAISNSGGLGSLPVGNIAPATVRELIRDVRQRTQQPFAVNVFTYELPPAPDAGIYNNMQAFLRALYSSVDLPAQESSLSGLPLYSYHDIIPILIAEEIKIVSFTFGLPDAATITLMKQAGMILIGTATSLEEALVLQDAGVDALVAQGIEAGGHRGSFLGTALPQVSTMTLISEMKGRISLPVIAAGGIIGGEGIAAALALGASGVQPGSAFLRCPESSAGEAHKALIGNITDTDTRLTRAFSGRWARGVPNTLIREVEASGLALPPYPYQDALTQPARKVSREKNNPGFVPLWAGQAAGKAKALPAADIFKEMITTAAQLISSLQ